MNGAVQAGERAAREVLHQMGKISEDAIHQVEPPPADIPPFIIELSFLERNLPSVPMFLSGMTIGGAVGGFLVYKYLL